MAEQMDIAGPRLMRRSVLLGWPRDDLELHVQWERQQRQVHPPCGTRPDEWDPAQGGHEHAYKAEIRTCRGCETLASGQKQLPKELAALGAHVVLVRNTEVDDDQPAEGAPAVELDGPGLLGEVAEVPVVDVDDGELSAGAGAR